MYLNLYSFREIVGILPDYNREGENICHIIRKDGTSEILTMKASKFLSKWLETLDLDLSSRRVWANNLLGKRHLNPIVISPNTCLIPVKTREPIGAKDGCYTYVKYEAMKSFNQKRILLEGGSQVEYISSIKTLQSKLRDADYLKTTYEKRLKAEYEACMAEVGNFIGPKDETREGFVFSDKENRVANRTWLQRV